MTDITYGAKFTITAKRERLVTNNESVARLIVTAVLLSICFFVSLPVWAKSSVQTVPVYKLVQSHFTLGKFDLLIADDAFKLTLQNKAVLMAKAPTWKVVLYRPEKRVYHDCSREDFLRSGLKWVQISGLPPIKYEQIHEKQVQGERVIVVAGTSADDRKYRYEVIEPVKVQKECCELIQRAFRVPFRHAIPLRCDGEEPGHDDLHNEGNVAWQLAVNARRPGGRSAMWRLMTFRWSRETVAKSEFDYPVGYKRVLTEPEVVLTAGSREIIDDLFGTDSSQTKPAKR
jgi:hypothetical protein